MFNTKAHDRWENVYMTRYGIHYSRVIASWIHVGGDVFDDRFKDWLRSIKDNENGMRVFDEDQISDIYNLATCGKMEWEADARRFLNK